MALLASCWLIVESFVVPHGFLKWFYLSFYIHPVLLVFCQVFLWLKELMKLLICLFYPLIVAFRLCLFVFGLIKRVVLFLFSYVRPTKVDVFYDALEPDLPKSPLQDSQMVVSCRKSTRSSPFQVVYRSRVELGVVEMGKVRLLPYPNLDTYEATEEINHDRCCVKDSWLNEFLNSDHYNSSAIIHDIDMSESKLSDESFASTATEVLLDQHKHTSSFRFSVMDESADLKSSHETEDFVLAISQDDTVTPLSSFDFNNSLSAGDVVVDKGHSSLKQQFIIEGDVEDFDAFHHKYTSRVRFFNVLYHERLHGINAISNEHLSTPSVFNSIEESTDYPMQCVVWIRVARKRVLRSLECDLEMICVAQSCLFWEALDHQYHKVESLSLSNNSGNILFHHNVSGKFQELQILLERFVEDERCECKGWSWSRNSSKRLSFQALLQAPDVTGFVIVEEENMMMSEDYCIRPTQLLEAIDNCIRAFWLYIKTDEKKSFWKYMGIWRAHPPVEDPRDLELLYDVLNNLEKKGIMLTNVKGKNNCWMRRKVKLVQAEHEKRNLLAAMIDMKLVQRMLQMSLISRSHLKWCREKLDNIDFRQDKVFRGRLSQLFPLP